MQKMHCNVEKHTYMEEVGEIFIPMYVGGKK